MSIEIKIGQKWRVVDAEGFGSSRIADGDVITIDSIESGLGGSGAWCEYRDHTFDVFMIYKDITNGYVELVGEPFDSITQQIPPVGTKCLYSFDKHIWWECEIISQNRPVIYCPHLDDTDGNGNGLQVVDENAGHYINTWYKPLPEEKPKSATQIRMEEIERQMRELAKYLLKHWHTFEHQHRHLVSEEDLKAGTLYALEDEQCPLLVKAAADMWMREVAEKEAQEIRYDQ